MRTGLKSAPANGGGDTSPALEKERGAHGKYGTCSVMIS